jgi:hypothetical protein
MASPAGPRKNSWKAKAVTQRSKSPGARWIGRILSTLLAAGLLSLLVYLLVVVLSTSSGNSKLLAVHLEDDDARQLLQVPFSKADCRAFQDVAKLHPKVIGWSDADFGKSLSRQISQLQCQPNDVLLIYLTGIGISHDHKAYVVCRESDLMRNADEAPPAGCLEVATLLKDVHKAAGKEVKKVLILDLGRLAIDPRIGLVVNEFPKLLEDEIKESGASDLWVLNSTALFQTARLRYSQQRSVFGQAVAEALGGQADGGIGKAGNGSVRLFELYGYVLQKCAAQSRGDDSISGQTPLLMRAGKKGGVLGLAALSKQEGDDSYDPVLVRGVSAAPGAEQPSAAPADGGKSLQKSDSGKSASRRGPGQFRRWTSGPLVAFDHLAALGAIQDARDAKAPAVSNDGQPATTTEKATPDKSEKSLPAAPAAAGDRNAASIPAAESQLPETASRELRSLAAAWKLHDELQIRQPGQRRSPVDFAPQLWRALDARLLTLERRYLTRHESEADARDLDDVVQLLTELKSAIRESRLVSKNPLVDPLANAWNQFLNDEHDRPPSAFDLPVLALQQDFADLCWQAAYVVQWFDHSSLSDAARAADADPSIKPFVEGLASLNRQVEGFVRKSSKHPLPDKDYQPLIKQCDELKEQFGRIRQAVAADRSLALLPGSDSPVVAETRAENLLLTPLCSATDRLSLYQLLRPAGEAPPAGGPPGAPLSPPWDAAQEIKKIKQIKWWEGTSAQWRALHDRAELHLSLVRLSGGDASQVSTAAGRLTNLPDKLDERLHAYADFGRELGIFYAGLNRQIADPQADPFQAWRLAQLVDGRDLADRRDQEARPTGFFWNLRVLRNAGRVDFAPTRAVSLFEEDFVPLRVVAAGWSDDLSSVDVGVEFDPQRVEFRLAGGKPLQPHEPITLPLATGTGQGELVLGAKWKGPKSPPADARQTKISVAVVARDDLASVDSPAELIGELHGARPVELAIHRHGMKGKPMPAVLDASGGSASLQIIPGRQTGFGLSLANRTRDDVAASIQLLAVPSLPAPAGRNRPGSHAAPTSAELRSLLVDETGKIRPELVLAEASAEGKPLVSLKPGNTATSLSFQKPKPAPVDATTPADKTKPPTPADDPAKLSAPPNWDGRRLACVVKTEQPAWNWIYLLDLHLVTPRDFLEPRVEYTLDTQDINVVLTVKESSRDLVPDLLKAPLEIRLKTGKDSAEGGIPAVLQGAECQLRWSVPADHRTRQFELDVAGYPRAFRYQIVCAEGREGNEVSPPRPTVRIRSLHSVAKNPFIYVADPFALGDIVPAGAAPPAGADPAAPIGEKWLGAGTWAAFPAGTREVEVLVAVDLPIDDGETAVSRAAVPVNVRLEDTAKTNLGDGRLIANGLPDFRLSLREDGTLAVAGELADRKFLVPVGSAPRLPLSLVAELIDDKAGENDAPIEDRVPVVVDPRPLDIRFTTADKSEGTATVIAGSVVRLNVSLVSEESSGKPRPNAGIAPKRVAISIKGADDKLQVLKDEEDLTVVEQDQSHWIAKWKVPEKLAEQKCTLMAVVFDGLGKRTEESLSLFVKSPAGKPVAGAGKAPVKGTIRIKSHVGATQLKSPKLDELPGRQPVAVRVNDVEYWDFTNLDLDQGYTVTADYFHDGTFEVLTSEPNVKPSDPKSVRVVPLASAKKKKP